MKTFDNLKITYLNKDDMFADMKKGSPTLPKRRKRIMDSDLVFYIKANGSVKLIKDRTGLLKDAQKLKEKFK